MSEFKTLSDEELRGAIEAMIAKHPSIHNTPEGWSVVKELTAMQFELFYRHFKPGDIFTPFMPLILC